MEIIPNEALIVRKIYSLHIGGMSVIKIKQYLESNNVTSPTGKETWSKHTIETILTKLRTTDLIRRKRQHPLKTACYKGFCGQGVHFV